MFASRRILRVLVSARWVYVSLLFDLKFDLDSIKRLSTSESQSGKKIEIEILYSFLLLLGAIDFESSIFAYPMGYLVQSWRAAIENL